MGHVSSAATEKNKIKIVPKGDCYLQRLYKVEFSKMNPMGGAPAKMSFG